MKPILQQLTQLLHEPDARRTCAMIAGIATLALGIWRVACSRRPDPEEIERRRREQLAVMGRIASGVLLEAKGLEADMLEANTLAGADGAASRSEVLVYTYRISGVTYQCAQDISRLMERAPTLHLGNSVAGQSVQVRYDPHNPGNSILVSETWTGLWNRGEK